MMNRSNFIRLLEQSPVEQVVWRAMRQASALSNPESKYRVPPTDVLQDLIYAYINNPEIKDKLVQDLERYYKIGPNGIYTILNDIQAGLRNIDR